MNVSVFQILFGFRTLFSIDVFDSFHYVLEKSFCSKFIFDFCLGHQNTLSELDANGEHTIVVGFVTIKPILLKASARVLPCWCALQRKIANALLLILADAAFVNSSSAANRYAASASGSVFV